MVQGSQLYRDSKWLCWSTRRNLWWKLLVSFLLTYKKWLKILLCSLKRKEKESYVNLEKMKEW